MRRDDENILIFVVVVACACIGAILSAILK